MLIFLKMILHQCIRFCGGILAIACLFYRDGRENLLRRNTARTDLEILSVEQKRMEIEHQKRLNVITVVQEVDKINDPALRDMTISAISHPQTRRLGKANDAARRGPTIYGEHGRANRR
jgi:hypothetical protein